MKTGRAGNENISKLNTWEFYACLRASYPFRVLKSASMAVMVNQPEGRAFFSGEALRLIQDMKIVNEHLQQGNKNKTDKYIESVSCIGYDKILDNLLMAKACENPQNSNNPYHDSYKCANSNQMISIFFGFAKEITDNAAQFTPMGGTEGMLNIGVVPHMIHLAQNHLVSNLEKNK